MTYSPVTNVHAPERLEALGRSGLLDSLPEESFDRLTRLASRFLDAPVALVTLLDVDRQFFKSAVGLGEPWASRREMPIVYSFCQHALKPGEPLVIEDARLDPRTQDSPAVSEDGFLAYVGVPLASEGQILGTLCVVDTKPRQWTEEEIQTLRDLAAGAETEIELRRAERGARQSEDRLRSIVEAQQVIAGAGLDLDTVLAEVVERVRSLTRAAASVVELAEGKEMVYGAASGSAAPHVGLRLGIATSISGLCVRTGEILRSDDTEQDERVDREACRRVGARSLVVVPLTRQDRTVGVLKVYHSRPAAFTEADVQTLQFLAGLLASSLDDAERFAHEQQLSARLRASEQRFRHLSAASREAVFVTENGVIFDVNEAAARMFGCAGVDEMTGRPALDFAAPESHAVMRERNRSGFPDPYEMMGLRVDGTRFPVEAHGETVRYDGREVRVTTVRDLTERKRAEQALRESERRQRAMLDALPDLIFRFRRNGEILDLQDPDEADLYVSTDRIRGRRISELLPPEISSQILIHTERALASGGIESFEYALVVPRGEERYEARLVPSGPEEVLAVVRDVTDRWIAEEALERSEAKFRSLIENTSEVISIWDAEGTIRFESPAAERVLGYEIEELEGRKFFDFLHPDDMASIAEQITETLRRPGDSAPFEIRFRHKDGSYRWLEGIFTNLLHDPAVAGILSNSRDVTERITTRQQLEAYSRELERSNRELEDFGYIASHDLQEPLRKVQAFGDRLKSRYAEALDETGRDYLERMQGAAGRMQTLIQELLSYSRVTSKAQPFERLDLRQAAHEVVQDLSTRIETTQGCVEVESLPEIEADPLQMRQLLQNLLGNALKFHRESVPPRVTVSGEVSGEWAEIRVQDNGIGFESQYADRMFKPFERLHGRMEYEGTGMGLAIVRKIVERHGGSIRAESLPGEGATFVIRLPREPNRMREVV